MLSFAVAPAVWSFATIAWFVLGLYVYVALVRQISVRTAPSGDNPPKRFGIPEALVAALLMSLLVIGLVKGGATSATEITTQDLINNFILTAVVVLVLGGFLVFRGFDVDALAGLSK